MKRLVVLAFTAAVAFACSWDYPIWIPRSKSADPLYRFVKNGKAGYIDGSGRIVIPPKLKPWGNYGSEFHDGLLEIAVSDGRYVDRTGKLVIDKGFYRGWDFSEGLAVAMRKGENLWGYIDTTGEFAISPRFETSPNGYVYPFFDGLSSPQCFFGRLPRSRLWPRGGSIRQPLRYTSNGACRPGYTTSRIANATPSFRSAKSRPTSSTL